MSKRSRLLLLPVTAVMFFFAAMPARAFMGPSVVIDAGHATVYRHYTAPEAARPVTQTGDWTLPECEGASGYCEALPFSFHPTRNGYTVTSVDVVWTGGSSTSLKVRVYDDSHNGTDNTPAQYATLGDLSPDGPTCQKKIHQDSCGEMHADLQDLPPGPYHIALLCNRTGGCTTGGFWLTVHVEYPALYSTPPTTGPTPTEIASSQPAPTLAPVQSTAPTPDAPLTPGPDGTLRANVGRTIPLAQQASPPSNAMSKIANIVAIALLLLIVGGGGAMIVRRIRRDLRG